MEQYDLTKSNQHNFDLYQENLTKNRGFETKINATFALFLRSKAMHDKEMEKTRDTPNHEKPQKFEFEKE